MNIRALAASTLAPVVAEQASLSGLLESAQNKAPERERKLLAELCLGSLRNYHSLNALLRLLLQKPLKTKDSDIHALLILGLYQLRALRIPDHAALGETVEAARILKKQWATKLINGILRNYLRRSEELEKKLENNQEFLHAHPKWMLQQFRKAWPQQWDKITEANNQQGPLTLRLNSCKTSAKALQEAFAEQGLTLSPLTFAAHGYTLKPPADITQLPGYSDGLFSVQDEAAQLSASLLALEPGQRVLDACCAPGGKTSHILELEPALKELVAIDLEEKRLERVKENLQRLDLDATLLCTDACAVEDWWDGMPFDRILLDAPCSATGVIRRHPDIKLLRRPDDLVKLSQLQARLLKQLWSVLAPGGVMLYATCSVLPQENTEVVSQFLAETDDAQHSPITADWGIEQSVGRQLLPQINGHDGFYYARIKKNA